MAESPIKKRKTDDIVTKTPQKNITFQLTPATKLKTSIASLSDSKLNPKCIGLLDVSHKGFEVTVRNTDTGVAANLFLDSYGLINFCCNEPIVGKMIDLYNIYRFLFDVVVDDHSDNDDGGRGGCGAIVDVFHIDGSTTLSFQCGGTELNVELLEMSNAEVEKFPDIKYFCEAVLSSEVLRELVEHIQKEADDHRLDFPLHGDLQPVSVDISEGLVTIFIGLMNSWQYKFVDDYSKNKLDYKGMAPGQKHHAWFQFRHLVAIKNASFLAPHLRIRYLTEPSKNVLLQFSLGELGDLKFIIKAIKVTSTTNCDEIHQGAASHATAVAP